MKNERNLEMIKYICKNNTFKKLGFTLAEVLISIVILGIVAAITIPSTVKNVRDRETVNKVIKAYYTLSKAFDMAAAENGSIENLINFSLDNNLRGTTVADVFMPYLKIKQDCGISGDGCMIRADNICKSLSGELLAGNQQSPYNPCTTSTYPWNWVASYYRILTNDGMGIAFQSPLNHSWYERNDLLCLKEDGSPSNCGELDNRVPTDNANIVIISTITVDINGIKEPNTLGKDIFVFALTRKGIFPYPNMGCNINGNGVNNGMSCAHHIIRNKNMNYLKRH